MASIHLQDEAVEFDDPTLVEGFPGLGFVGKIATDHLVDVLEMDYYGSVHCEGLPAIGTYRSGDRTVRPPVRLYASEADDLLALQSDVPIAAGAVREVADCVTGWIEETGATPLYLSGLPMEDDGDRTLYGVATGADGGRLESQGIDPPVDDGAVSGPTGALLDRALVEDVDALGLIVQCNPKFPDPTAAKILVEDGIEPLAGVSVDVTDLIERAEEIRAQREELAQRMQALGQEESTQARPMQMFQ